MSSRKIFQYWFPVFLWIGFIFWMSTETFSAQKTYVFFEKLLRFFPLSISQKEIFALHIILRKFAHVTEYLISGFLLFRAFKNDSDKRREWYWAIFSLVIIVTIALSDEFHQTVVPSRTASIVDVGIDILGGFFAQCVSILMLQRNRKVKKI